MEWLFFDSDNRFAPNFIHPDDIKPVSKKVLEFYSS